MWIFRKLDYFRYLLYIYIYIYMRSAYRKCDHFQVLFPYCDGISLSVHIGIPDKCLPLRQLFGTTLHLAMLPWIVCLLVVPRDWRLHQASTLCVAHLLMHISLFFYSTLSRAHFMNAYSTTSTFSILHECLRIIQLFGLLAVLVLSIKNRNTKGFHRTRLTVSTLKHGITSIVQSIQSQGISQCSITNGCKILMLDTAVSRIFFLKRICDVVVVVVVLSTTAECWRSVRQLISPRPRSIQQVMYMAWMAIVTWHNSHMSTIMPLPAFRLCVPEASRPVALAPPLPRLALATMWLVRPHHSRRSEFADLSRLLKFLIFLAAHRQRRLPLCLHRLGLIVSNVTQSQ